jgi:hypothetical protein
MCQLQISLYNKGVFEALAALEALDERQYQSKVRRFREDCPWPLVDRVLHTKAIHP